MRKTICAVRNGLLTRLWPDYRIARVCHILDKSTSELVLASEGRLLHRNKFDAHN
jgi:hypothetical protein